MKKILLILIAILFLAPFQVFAESSTSTTPEPYEYEEFPEFMHQVRRAEIISLGSLPFVMIGTSLVYGAVQYFSGNINTFPNPFDKSTSYYTEDQQRQIFGISLGVSVGIGVTDLIINNVISSSKKNKELERQKNNQVIIVEEISEDEVAFKRSQSQDNENLTDENQSAPEEKNTNKTSSEENQQ